MTYGDCDVCKKPRFRRIYKTTHGHNTMKVLYGCETSITHMHTDADFADIDWEFYKSKVMPEVVDA